MSASKNLQASDSILVVGGPKSDDLPHLIKFEDQDAWANSEAAIRMTEVLAAIAKAGYSGIRVKVLGTSPSGKAFWNLQFNRETPEGRFAEWLLLIAKKGASLLPIDEFMSILERVYREQGLPLPKKTKPGV